jgi:hypothetical protein
MAVVMQDEKKCNDGRLLMLVHEQQWGACTAWDLLRVP